MASSTAASILHYLRFLGATAADDEPSDGQLLGRFLAQRDEGAFATLMRRHGPVVLAVCQRVLRNLHDAEDAFQATFLVLARKGASVRKHHSLAAWLHRVALNLARTASATAAQRQAREREVVPIPATDTVDDVASRDWQQLLHEEVDRLPKKYRVPVILCHFKGATHDEAARQLGWPLGTVSGRLARARGMLRTRLARRGLALTTAGLAAMLTAEASAVVPPALLGLTLRAAVSFAAGGAVSAGVVALAKGALQTMTATKLMLVLLVLSAVGLLGSLFALGGSAREGPRGDDSAPGVIALRAPVAPPREKKESDMAESEPVRVEGLEFVALIPKRIPVPDGAARDVALGLRITNISDKPLTISVFDVILPWIVNTVDGVKLGAELRRKDTPKHLPPVTLAPGKSWTWQPRARLDRTTDRATLRLSGPDGLGAPGGWSISTLKVGKHRLSIAYHNSNAKQGDVPLWVGKATTKEVEFEIVENREPGEKPAAKPVEDAAKGDLEKLRGTWRLVAAEEGGKPLPPANFGRNTHWVFSGADGTFKSGKRVMSGTVTLDPAKDPKWIDLTLGKDMVLQGIYELKGDTLRVFLLPAGSGRPTEFKTREGAPQTIGTYERVKTDP
jgi:RNA polymerase sigma factor (sigma-70 family)